MIKPNLKTTAIILLILISIPGVAQNSAGGGSGPPPPQGATPPPGLPIDDGLIVLFVAALIYGIYIIVKYSKKHTQA
ncbi:hypothetical protein [Gelidibacter gilvus]|uniref:hypothetical protein n=1 Tax=Gelidibacter gilvus TaxID=59602 RepID=UPI001CB96A82|nr:hypothetical protein [Gelidibacter gilvus]